MPKPARTKYEAACWSNWAAKNDPATQRTLVEARDKGICAACGVDTEKRAREAREWRPVFRWLARRFLEDEGDGSWQSWSRSEKYASDMICDRFGAVIASDGHTWEADHILPVVEGGGECDLSNLRTLCLPCHRAETAKLAARRAAARRAAREAAQLQMEVA